MSKESEITELLLKLKELTKDCSVRPAMEHDELVLRFFDLNVEYLGKIYILRLGEIEKCLKKSK